VKDYDKMLEVVNSAMKSLNEVKDELQDLADDQQKEIDSMVAEYKEIEKLNERLGEMLNDRK
jgi:DNA-binding transcriptional regulator GbsR (MarR family)